MNKLSIVFSIVLVSILAFLYTPLMNTEADTPPLIIDISTNPKSTFIDIGNLKPGDTVIHSVKVQNSGNADFTYYSFAEFQDGSKEYFDKLLIAVKDNKNNLLFEGLLSEFNGFTPRTLVHNSEEEISFEVNVPSELDNNFQGLSTNVLFKFAAQNEGGQEVIGNIESEPVNGSQLPNTSTGTFNLIIAGAVLVLGGGIYYFRNKRKIVDIKK